MGCSAGKDTGVQNGPGEIGRESGSELPFRAKYNAGPELGRGAFSVVYECTPKKAKYRPCADTDSYAVKVIQRSELSEDDRKGLEQEIDIMGEINHKNVIRLYETFTETREIYLVIERVNGGELFERIVKKSRYSELEARNVVKTILRTLAFLHSKGIVHRDLKPENLLLCSEDDDLSIKIADFGFAKKTHELAGGIEENQSLDTQCGTPGYVAPEILSQKPYGPPVDVWSMGVCVYILLGGYPPFYHEKQNELFKLIKKAKFQFHEKYWKHISKEAQDFISSMLVVSPDERLTCEQLLHHDWITQGDDMLSSRDISQTISEMKKWNARRKFVGAVNTVIATNRFVGGGFASGPSDS